MTKVTDEQLSAFLDGALPEEDMAFVAAAIEEDESLAERLAELGDVDTSVRALFESSGETPIRRETLDLIDAAIPDEAQEIQIEDNVVSLKPKTTAKQANNWWPQAVAASVALVIGLTGGSYLTTEKTTENQFAQMIGSVQASSPLYSALSSGISGEPVIFQGQTLTPTASFATSGGFCREFELSDATTNSRNIACTAGDSWTVVASVAADNTDTAQSAYSPASSSAAVIDQMILALIQGDILSQEDEQKLISSGWK